MHHSNSRSSCRRKRADSISESEEEFIIDSFKFDDNACGDYMESTQAGKMKSADVQREAKKGRGKRHSLRRSKKPEAKAHEIAFKHHSLNTTITNTKLLFRKEKSFNDGVQKSIEWKDKEDERKWEQKQNHLIRRSHERDIRKDDKCGQREEKEQQNAALIDNSQEVKDRRGKSLQKGHRSTDRSSLLNMQNFNRVQEVIYCQVSHVPPSLKNYKNLAKVKYLYRHSKKESKDDNQLAGSSRQKYVPCLKTRADPNNGRMEQNLTKFKKKSKQSESEELVAEMRNADYKSGVQQRGNMPIEARKHKDAGNNISKVKSGTEECVRGQWQQKIKSKTKHHVTRECSHSRKCSRGEHFQSEDHKIYQIVEETYLKKIQSLIDRKLNTLINESKEIKLKVEHVSNISKSVRKGRKSCKSGKCVKGHATRSTIKEDIVNEVLRRLKEEPIEKETRGSRKKISTDLPTANAHKDIHVSAIKVFKNRAHKHHHSRRKSDRIPSEDQAALAKNQEVSATLPNISPDKFPDNFVLTHKSRHNYGRRRRVQKDKTTHSSIYFPDNQACNSEKRPQKYPQLHMMSPYSSDSSSKQKIISTSKKVGRYHESNPRSCWKFAQEPDHQEISITKPKSPSNPYNEFLRSPLRTRVTKRSPHLEQIFLLPDSFKESQSSRHDFGVNGIEPTIQDFKHVEEARNTKRLECKIFSITAIHPQKIRITDVMGNKEKKYSGGRDLSEKRKLCRRFKLYYKYFAIEDNVSEGSCDGRTLLNDSTRIVSDLSEKDTIREQNLQNKSQRVDTEVLQKPKSSNQLSTPRNSNLNNTIEGFSNICFNAKNGQYFVPITGTNEFYCRLLTSSCSENYLDTEDSNISIPSKNTDREIHVCCEEGKCRCCRPDKSHSDCRLLSNLNFRQQMYISKSDVTICGGARQAVKAIFKADPCLQSKSNRIPNNFFLSVEKRTKSQISSCKESQRIRPREGSCPEEDANPIFQSVTDFQGSKVVKRPTPPVNNIGLAVGSPLPLIKVDLAASPIRTAGNKKDNELEAELAVDVAVGESELMLPIKARRDKKRVEMAYVGNKKSTAVSSIRVIEEPLVQVATKSSRKIKRPKQPLLSNSHQETPIQSKNSIQTASTRKLQIRSIQYGPTKSRMQVQVELFPVVTPRGAKTEESTWQYIKVCRSPTQIMVDVAKKQSVQKIQASEEAMSEIRGVTIPCHGNQINPETNKAEIRKPADVAESWFHSHDPFGDPNARSPSSTLADSNPLINEDAAIRSCQSGSFDLNEAAEGTSSLVSDIEHPDCSSLKSKSLVDVKRPLRDDTDRSKSEICCGISGFVDTNEFILEIKGESYSSDLENTMDKCANNLNLRYTSRSCGSSVDQYVTNKLIVGLVLAKDYSTGLISAYQKGKLYDASRRKNTKKNVTFRKDVDMGHESYDVRPSLNQPKHANQTFEKSILSLNLENVVGRDKDETSASLSRGPEVDSTSNLKNNDCKFEKEDGINMTVDEDQERLKAICRRLLNLKAIDDDTFQEAICTCLQFAHQCSACKNFLVLMDNIQSLFARYRSESNGHFGSPQKENFPNVHTITQPPPPLDDRSESECYLEKSQKENSSSVHINIGFPLALENSSESNGLHEKFQEENSSGVHTIAESPPALGDTLNIEEIYSASLNNFSSDSSPMAVLSDKELDGAEFISCESSKENGWRLIIQSMSCPTLATTSSSFKFFSEDEASIDNEATHRETLLVDLTRPFDHIFSINTCQYNMEMSYFAKSNSGSVKSGYSTIRSSNYYLNCPVNFFERTKIAVPFKPSKLTERPSNKDLDENIYSEGMIKSCRKSARKVREINSLKESDEEQNTEFSLQFLLSDNESGILENRALSASRDNEAIENERMAAIVKDGDSVSETQLLEVKEVERAPSSFSMGGWKLILCNSCLKSRSEIQLESTLVENLINNENLYKVEKEPLNYSDVSMEKFLKALIRAYDKEVEVCNKLYDDNEFYNVLLELIQERKRQKKRSFFKLFSRKPVGFRRRKIDDNNLEQEIPSLKKLKTKLQSLGSDARRCFPMLAEALRLNENINQEQKICGISEWLERIDNGEFELEQNGEINDLEARITHHVKDSLIIAHKMCARDAEKQKRKLGNFEIKLLMLLVMKYKFCLLCKADVIISFIGRGIISTEFELEAAVTYLMRTGAEEINRSMFEEYCRSLNK